MSFVYPPLPIEVDRRVRVEFSEGYSGFEFTNNSPVYVLIRFDFDETYWSNPEFICKPWSNQTMRLADETDRMMFMPATEVGGTQLPVAGNPAELSPQFGFFATNRRIETGPTAYGQVGLLSALTAQLEEVSPTLINTTELGGYRVAKLAVSGDAFNRVEITNDGSLYLGDGVAAPVLVGLLAGLDQVEGGDTAALSSAQSYTDNRIQALGSNSLNADALPSAYPRGVVSGMAWGVTGSLWPTSRGTVLTHRLAGDENYTVQSFYARDSNSVYTRRGNADDTWAPWTDLTETAEAGVSQTYVDDGDAAALSSAQSYADSGDAATLSSAQSYTRDRIDLLPTAHRDEPQLPDRYPVGLTQFVDVNGGFPGATQGLVTTYNPLNRDDYTWQTFVGRQRNGSDRFFYRQSSADTNADGRAEWTPWVEYAPTAYVDDGDAAALADAKTYADSGDSKKLDTSGDALTGDLDMNFNAVFALPAPVGDAWASTKLYTDDGDAAALADAKSYTDSSLSTSSLSISTQIAAAFSPVGDVVLSFVGDTAMISGQVSANGLQAAGAVITTIAASTAPVLVSRTIACPVFTTAWESVVLPVRIAPNGDVSIRRALGDGNTVDLSGVVWAVG